MKFSLPAWETHRRFCFVHTFLSDPELPSSTSHATVTTCRNLGYYSAPVSLLPGRKWVHVVQALERTPEYPPRGWFPVHTRRGSLDPVGRSTLHTWMGAGHAKDCPVPTHLGVVKEARSSPHIGARWGHLPEVAAGLR
ncbi:hypothetical protein BV22DRAFT_465520 [Leucogyrophana mollusca]|uniref:Uncharacterized protein n=1 Tax=Leucogyrophana mollusca TaxID=85980 RepID=A0ACB8BGT2_9AGAM|nr:hypothetical protein BV22DRAFT_465520 [Leucogyrophana mollusca]